MTLDIPGIPAGFMRGLANYNPFTSILKYFYTEKGEVPFDRAEEYGIGANWFYNAGEWIGVVVAIGIV